MSFFTLRNKDWTGGDVTVSDDGRFVVMQVRDVTPVKFIVILDTQTCTTHRGDWKTVHDAQLAAEKIRKGGKG